MITYHTGIQLICVRKKHRSLSWIGFCCRDDVLNALDIWISTQIGFVIFISDQFEGSVMRRLTIFKTAATCTVSFHPLQWPSNERHGVLNHRLCDCLFNSLCGPTSKETSNLCFIGLLWRKSTGDPWVPLTKGRWRGKGFHIMKSRWECWLDGLGALTHVRSPLGTIFKMATWAREILKKNEIGPQPRAGVW